jgi:hypothetical protein
MFSTSVSYQFTPAEAALAKRMSTYWANFAHSGALPAFLHVRVPVC